MFIKKNYTYLLNFECEKYISFKSGCFSPATVLSKGLTFQVYNEIVNELYPPTLNYI